MKSEEILKRKRSENMELRMMTIDDIKEAFGDNLPKHLGDIEFVQQAEMALALAIDACDETRHFSSTAIEGSDGSVIVVTARYADGIPPLQKYLEAEQELTTLRAVKEGLFDELVQKAKDIDVYIKALELVDEAFTEVEHVQEEEALEAVVNALARYRMGEV